MKFDAEGAFRNLGFAVLTSFLLLGCSTKKDALVNRKWHALNTKYNTLYNGSLAFEEGRTDLQSGFEDNFWEVLPIERLERDARIKLDSEDNSPQFKRAEEKATKAIQKHAMNIEDRERNPQTDEAFMLLGKARYFDHRYIPALEAFNYILKNYPDSDLYYQAGVWKQKTLMRMDYPELAIRNTKRLLRYQDFNNKDFSDIHAILAQAFLQMNQPDSAIFHLQWAQSYAPSRLLEGRYMYIIGQLYDRKGVVDSANYAFQKVIDLNRKIPWVYHIHAQLEQFSNLEPGMENREELLKYISKIEENRENRPYLDKIFRQKAIFHMRLAEDSLGLAYYDKSTAATEGDRELLARNYIDLANYYFDRKEYSLSGVYYDSILMQLDTLDSRYRPFAKRSENLKDIVIYEQQVQRADSIVRVSEMDGEQRVQYLLTYIEELKERREEAERRAEEKRRAALEALEAAAAGKASEGGFYFYNNTALNLGKQTFSQNWGDRSLSDNWRWSRYAGGAGASVTESGTQVTDSVVSPATLTDTELAYYEERALDAQGLDSVLSERNFALYQLGLLYKEKFKEYPLASNRLERLLTLDPEERLVLPAKYNLYRIYEQLDSQKALSYRQDIIDNHPNTRYSEILLNPEAVLKGDAESPDARYNQLYRRYEAQDYLAVIYECEALIKKYEGDQAVPKFELLKASAVGRLYGFEKYKAALKEIALAYPNVNEGKKAQRILDQELTALARTEFDRDTVSSGAKNWKVVFPFKIRDNQRALSLKKRLEESIEELRYKNKVSKDIYSLEDQFVVVHGFKSKEFALGYVELLRKNKDYRIRDENFVISSENYQIIQVHKNLEKYKEQKQLLN